MPVTPRFGDGHRVLVSGGAGFVPSHVVDALIARGCHVVAIDNFITGTESNVAHLAGNPLFTLVKADISDGLPVERALAGRFDAILHMASPASPVDFATLPVEILRVGSLATFHLLDRARHDEARFLMASTSEAYGDPLVHPQPETYWGNVNPVGVRSVYDESKRFAEATTMAYRRTHGVDTAIVRIFNSILADEMVLFDDGNELRHEPIQDLAQRVGTTAALTGYTVPAFRPGGAMSMSEATWLVGHPTGAKCYRVTTSYGRTIAVTGDHSLFTRNETSGEPEARPVHGLKIGDPIAISGRVDVVERDRKVVSMLDVIDDSGIDPCEVLVSWPGLDDATRVESAPLAQLRQAGIPISTEASVRLSGAGEQSWLPLTVEISDELLWSMGRFVAEGSPASCDRLLLGLWRRLGLAEAEKRIPAWILSLPLARLRCFMEGCGLGTRDEFSTTSTRLKDDLVVAFTRFGLVPRVDRDEPLWRLTLAGVADTERHGDLVWATVDRIEEVPATPLVYDFCVPGKENFWAGTGVMAHNTYGPRMRANDGRFIPTFISQALRGEPLTVHGTGGQTRSICYVDDLVRGILLMLDSTEGGPINCGTEFEMSVIDLARKIITLSGSNSEVVLLPRTPDDPERRRPDLTLARTKLGFEPLVGVDEGLRATIDYFRQL